MKVKSWTKITNLLANVSLNLDFAIKTCGKSKTSAKVSVSN